MTDSLEGRQQDSGFDRQAYRDRSGHQNNRGEQRGEPRGDQRGEPRSGPDDRRMDNRRQGLLRPGRGRSATSLGVDKICTCLIKLQESYFKLH